MKQIIDMVVHIDLTKTSHYGIPCCSKHLYYKKGDFSTKQVQVKCFKNGTHTMYLHSPVNEANIGPITHKNYENMFIKHTDKLRNRTINEVAVIYKGSSSTAIPILVLLNEKPTPNDSSTTQGCYFQDPEKKRGDTFTQYSFKQIKAGCKLMDKLTGEAETVSDADDDLREFTQALGETWTDLIKEKLTLQESSDLEEDTSDCKAPVGSDLSTGMCPAVKEEAPGPLEVGSPVASSGNSSERKYSERTLQEQPVSEHGDLERSADYKGHPDIKVYTLEGNVAKANDTTKFEVTNLFDQQFFYKFRPGAQCVEVRFRNSTVWIHDGNAHGGHFPATVAYRDDDDRLYVQMAGSWVFYYFYKHGAWTMYKINLTGRPATLTPAPADLKITYEDEAADANGEPDLPRGKEVTEHPDISITSRNKLNEIKVNNKSDYRVYEYGETLTFCFQNGAKCLKVEYRGKEAWRHGVAEYGTKYPRLVVLDARAGRLDVVFNAEWYYGFALNAAGKWELKNKRLVMKPGELPELMKKVFNIDLAVSPSLLSYFSGMSIRTIRFFLNFYPTIDAGLKTLIDKLYHSEMYWETLPAIVANPDQLPKLMDMIKGTSFSLEEARLHDLIVKPALVLHLLKELKTVGFNVEELLKKLLLEPEKLKNLLDKMKGLGYALNLTEIRRLAQNKDLLKYLKIDPIDVKVVGPGVDVAAAVAAGDPGTKAEPGSKSATTQAPGTEPAPSQATKPEETTDPEPGAEPGTGSSGADGQAPEDAAGASEGGAFMGRAAKFFEENKTEISAGSGTVVSIGVVGTVGAVVYTKVSVGTSAAAVAAALI